MKYQYPHQRVTGFFRAGRDDSKWYDEAAKVADEFDTPEEGNLFLRFLAVTSQNTSVSGNITLAKKALRQYQRGQPFKGFLGVIIKNLERVAGGDLPNGPKIRAFTKALLGDPDSVVVDIWMHRAYQLGKGKNPSLSQLEFIESNVRERAERAGVQPREYQAAVWHGIKMAQDPYARDNRPYSAQL